MNAKTDAKFLKMIQDDRRLFRVLSKKMSLPEKQWLLMVDGRYELYQDRLRQLAEHHKIKIPKQKKD
jgi:hypothetical protein